MGTLLAEDKSPKSDKDEEELSVSTANAPSRRGKTK